MRNSTDLGEGSGAPPLPGLARLRPCPAFRHVSSCGRLKCMAGPDQSQPVSYGIVPDPSQPGQAASYPTGQYPPAAGQYAAAPASPTGYGEPKPPRRRRTVLVVSLVVVLVLAVVAGTGAVLLLRNRGGSNDAPGSDSTASADSTDAASSGGRWSSAWLDGFEEAWALDAPPASGKKRAMSVKVAEDKLIRTVSASKTTTVTVFQLGDGQPDQLWEEDVSGSTLWITIWKNWIVVGNTLVDIDSREHTTAPWAENALVSSSHGSAIACVDTTCTMWTSPTEKKWEAELPETTSVRVLTSIFHWLVEWGLAAALPVSWLGLCRLGVTACRVSPRGGRAFPGARVVPSGSWWTGGRSRVSTEPVGPGGARGRQAEGWSRGGRPCSAGRCGGRGGR